jgi:hypothetical protein
MGTPQVEIKYVDNTATDGYLRIIVNEMIQPSIRVHFDVGNESTIHMGLHKVLTHVYEQAYRDGQRDAKQKVCDFLDWAKSR